MFWLCIQTWLGILRWYPLLCVTYWTISGPSIFKRKLIAYITQIEGSDVGHFCGIFGFILLDSFCTTRIQSFSDDRNLVVIPVQKFDDPRTRNQKGEMDLMWSRATVLDMTHPVVVVYRVRVTRYILVSKLNSVLLRLRFGTSVGCCLFWWSNERFQ